MRRYPLPPDAYELDRVQRELDAAAAAGTLTEAQWQAAWSRALAALRDVEDDRRMLWLDPILDHGAPFGFLRE